MTVRVSLDKNLVIRYGNATYQFNRVLRDGGSSVQFENQRTGQFKEFELSKFYSMLQSKQLTVVQGETAEKEGDPPNKADVILDLSSLPEKEREQVGFRISLIRQIRKLGLSRGQRREISRVIEKNFSTGKWEKVWQKKQPPSTSAVMKWMRDYELSGGNAASLVSGYRIKNTSVYPPKGSYGLIRFDVMSAVLRWLASPALGFRCCCSSCRSISWHEDNDLFDVPEMH